MNKNIFILLLLIFPVNVFAETFYGSYYLHDENIEELYEETDVLKREENIFYQNYYEKKVNEEYYFLNENAPTSPFLDKEDFVKRNIMITEYKEGSTGPFTTQIIKEDEVRYIKLNKFISSNTYIKEIKVLVNGIESNYYMKSRNFYFSEMVKESGELIMDLLDEYSLSDIEIKIVFTTDNLNDLSFELSTSKDYISYYSYPCNILRSNLNEIYYINFLKDGNIEVNNYFIYPGTLYKYYDLKNVKTNQYTKVALENYLLDLNDFQIRYNYYKRDKIILNNIINKKTDNIIKYANTNNYSISTLNIANNGYQEVKLCLYDNLCFHKNILIDIDDNHIKEVIIKPSLERKVSNTNNFKPSKKTKTNNNDINIEESKEIFEEVQAFNTVLKDEEDLIETNIDIAKLIMPFILIIMCLLLYIKHKTKKGFVESV